MTMNEAVAEATKRARDERTKMAIFRLDNGDLLVGPVGIRCRTVATVTWFGMVTFNKSGF